MMGYILFFIGIQRKIREDTNLYRNVGNELPITVYKGALFDGIDQRDDFVKNETSNIELLYIYLDKKNLLDKIIIEKKDVMNIISKNDDILEQFISRPKVPDLMANLLFQYNNTRVF